MGIQVSQAMIPFGVLFFFFCSSHRTADFFFAFTIWKVIDKRKLFISKLRSFGSPFYRISSQTIGFEPVKDFSFFNQLNRESNERATTTSRPRRATTINRIRLADQSIIYGKGRGMPSRRAVEND
jgi:hypothetical protein